MALFDPQRISNMPLDCARGITDCRIAYNLQTISYNLFPGLSLQIPRLGLQPEFFRLKFGYCLRIRVTHRGPEIFHEAFNHLAGTLAFVRNFARDALGRAHAGSSLQRPECPRGG